jgi:hypothetical protein
MLDATGIMASLRTGACMVRDVDLLPRGHIRVQTGFLYPDGANIDVFVVNDPNAPLLPPTRLSDLGQTTAFLLNHEVRPWTSSKRRIQLQEAVSLYDVQLNGGALDRRIQNTGDDLRTGIVLLGQACVRMSDLLFTRRLQLQNAFNDDVEEFLADADLDYQPAVTLDGRFGPVAIDFLVRGRTTTSAVMTLFSRLPAAAHPASNEVFRKAHDIHAAGRSEQCVTLLDDSVDVSRVYRDEDLRRIETYSTIVPFSDRTATRTLLAA